MILSVSHFSSFIVQMFVIQASSNISPQLSNALAFIVIQVQPCFYAMISPKPDSRSTIPSLLRLALSRDLLMLLLLLPLLTIDRCLRWDLRHCRLLRGW